jgi:hypothetical protein
MDAYFTVSCATVASPRIAFSATLASNSAEPKASAVDAASASPSSGSSFSQVEPSSANCLPDVDHLRRSPFGNLESARVLRHQRFGYATWLRMPRFSGTGPATLTSA